ncbi:ATP-binding protein [Lichenicola cladoniae]|uniref:ATP-binding protein n=1 Tax=Lichenicola cladoniae TaxID=1484109 RepID=A0A6M8HN67_9PROT|nr:ATP-binding protein [Lichenicola cladoniae]NPD67213.1 ATP-binding protein [Acetobacteraceae bacterium]QKE89727.1 ATP-binding protein [Lichenicola cladoniae]
MTNRLTQLRVGDESFLVSSMIERCPKIMMLRELVRNALDAAATAPDGCRQVRLSQVLIDGVPKLAIWNSGRGMDADELFRMCDIASSIRKEHRLDQNFGMGAKVASLPSNRHGLRYRSCHAGVVHEVTLGWRDGVYGRLRRADDRGTMQDVTMVSADAMSRGHALDQDWTEVVLFGNSAAQDTVSDPYQGLPTMGPNWIVEELGYRFYRIENGISIWLDQHARLFEPLASRIPYDDSRHSSVTLPGDGMVLHYVYDAPSDTDAPRGGAGRDTLKPMPGTCGLIYRDELYDVLRQQHWLHAAPVFGVPFGAGSISVFIELPEWMDIVPDAYRQFLRHAGSNQGQVACRDFARVVHQHRPGWLIDIIENQSPSAKVSPDIYDDLDKLLRKLGVKRRRRVIPSAARSVATATREADPATQMGAACADTESPIERTAHGHLTTDHDPSSDDTFDTEPSPEILILRYPLEIDARGLLGRAGRYYPETHQLFLNATYPAVTEMRLLLEQEYAAEPDQQAVRRQSLYLAERSLAARVGRMLVFALSKQGKWPDHDIGQACSPEALSLVADDFIPSLSGARTSMQAILDLKRIVAEPA